MNATLLIADNDRKRRDALRRFFWESGFLVATSASARECLEELVSLEPDVLVISLDIPGGANAVIARLNHGLHVSQRPIVLVIGDAPAAALSVRTGAPVCDCFAWPVPAEDLLDRAGLELALRLLRYGEETQERSRGTHCANSLM